MLKHDLLASASVVPAGVIFAMAAEDIDTLQAKVDELTTAADELRSKEDLTDEDLEKIEANVEEVEKLNRRIAALKKLDTLKAGAGRRTSPETQNANQSGQRPQVPAAPRVTDARGGFRSFGEFAAQVRHGSIQGNQPDQRLLNAATTYGNEGTGADGGFLVPPEFSREIMQKVQSEETLLTRAAQLVTGSNNMTLPKDETTPWQSSGGVQVYWDGEAASITASKGVFETSNIRLAKLTALVPVSDELLDDAPGLESWLRAKAPAKMAAKINTAFVRGTGVGMPLGILAAPSLISVAKETSQPADTVWMKNIEKMFARMYAPWRRNAIWLINQDIEPSLAGMAFQATGASSDLPGTSAVPAYLPPGGLSNSPYGTLKGRPVVPLEACSAIGDQGDIILVDMNQYWAIIKSGGVKADTSIHLYFDQALTTFRFIFRLNGMPAWSSAIARENGSNTLSWAVTLDAR